MDAACRRIFANQQSVGLVIKTVSHYWLSQMFFYYQVIMNMKTDRIFVLIPEFRIDFRATQIVWPLST